MRDGRNAASLFFTHTAMSDQSSQFPNIKIEPYGTTSEGKEVKLFTLTHANGSVCKITNYGAIITELWAPDRSGELKDVVLGFPNYEGYIENPPFFGATIGRFGNRIAGAEFELNGKKYELTRTGGSEDKIVQIHGGVEGFDKKLWEAKPEIRDGLPVLELSYLSKDGEEGFPGNLQVTMSYTFSDEPALKIDYHAKTDAPTPVNLTDHSYFNLSGEGEGDILDHEVMIAADQTTEVSEGLLPTGNFNDVSGTPFDLRQARRIGDHIDADDEQLKMGGGYDHNFVLNNEEGLLIKAAEAYDPKSGRLLEVLTQEPGIQFYCGNFLDGTLKGKSGRVYQKRYGFCLETQHYPDSVNQPNFPSTILNPGETYETTTVYRFGVR